MYLPPEMAATGGMDKIYNCNIERSGQSSTFLGAFFPCALAFLQFVCSLAKFIKQNVKEHKKTIELDT